MQISTKKVEDAYQRNAKKYDIAVKFFYPLIGLKIGQYRKKAVNYLNLHKGDFVLDLGCGTGLCFSLLIDKIGPDGKLIGVDISSEMLSIAEGKVESAGWSNVQLVHSDIEQYEFPLNINGVISTGVFGYLNERTKILEKIHKSLVTNGRLVIVDGKRPQKWLYILFKLFVKLSSSYGLTESYFDNDTPEIVSRLFHNVTFEDMYGGLIYITSGEKL
ncbi:MAG: methyltransferase domain-containing protein [Candidatus Dadabacteria bacterium]|nr:methyltransferase domain-containing protein [Candidatus Dadabacteria bacterium]NIS08247.1 methyltransferase domain-containing protein [Candidatus Dadabacteria bacterium]NIV41514.1 methyltransferase domain-containing protein [Candidatus Dadabacteria bacterium]NIY21735.1 methyltransferase domain-containing protein [Candidatus Dadabacteria bacterium]